MMSIWKSIKSGVKSYLERKLEEQAHQKEKTTDDFVEKFENEFNEKVKEKITFHESIPEEERELIAQKIATGDIEGYQIPDLWKAQRNIDKNFKVIDFNAAKERLEQEDWKPTQVTRVCDGILSRISQESELDTEDEEGYTYYSWEVSSIDLNISVTGTSSTLEKAKKSCDLSAKYISKAQGPKKKDNE